MALVGGDLHQSGQNLQGIYANIWAHIVAAVTNDGTGDGPVTILDALERNTLAVLGPAAHQLGAWRDQLNEWHVEAVEQDDPGLADLIEAIVALLDAGGNLHGLGAGLQGPYAHTWQQIVQQLKP